MARVTCPCLRMSQRRRASCFRNPFMPVPYAVTAAHNHTFSLPEKLVVISRVPFTRLRHSLDVDSLPGSVDLNIGPDPLPLKTTHTGRVVYDPDAAV
jgi:hypothetical protein